MAVVVVNGQESICWQSRDPLSSGYWRRLMFERSRVWIPAPDTRRIFFTFLLLSKLYGLFEKTEKKLEQDGNFYKNALYSDDPSSNPAGIKIFFIVQRKYETYYSDNVWLFT